MMEMAVITVGKAIDEICVSVKPQGHNEEPGSGWVSIYIYIYIYADSQLSLFGETFKIR